MLGGCGFIGRHVALLLARRGHSVVIADRLPPTSTFPDDVVGKISWRPLQLASANWDSLVAEADVVHHYAWTSLPATADADPIGDYHANVTSTLSLLEALRRRGGGRIVFSSSGGTVYGKLHRIPVAEDHPLQPITAYGAGKVAAEVYLGLYRSMHGMDCRIARIANPYGAGQNFARGQGAATKFLHHALTNRPIVIWGDGEIVRDYVHILDVANALVSLSLEPRLDEFYTFNIGSGHGVSLNSIILELQEHLGKRLDVRNEPARPFDVPVSILDISRAQKVLKWEPHLDFSAGMARTLIDLSNGANFSSLDFAKATSSSLF